jgi:hypothetical protein
MKRIVLIALVVMLSVMTTSVRDSDAVEDRSGPFRVLEGAWEGEGEGFGQVSKLSHK